MCHPPAASRAGQDHAGEHVRQSEVGRVGRHLPAAVAATDLLLALAHAGRVGDDERGVDHRHRVRGRPAGHPRRRLVDAARPAGVEDAPVGLDGDDAGLVGRDAGPALAPRQVDAEDAHRWGQSRAYVGDDVGVAVEGAQGVVLAGRRHAEDAAGEAERGVVVDDLGDRAGSRTRRARWCPCRGPPRRPPARSSSSLSAMPRRPWIGIQPSQYSTMWRNVTGPPAPPMMIGGCGSLTGFGQLHDGGKLTYSPSNEASSCVHSSRIASTFSRATERRRLGSTPWCSISSSFQPTPMPSSEAAAGQQVERGDRLGQHDRVVLGDERDAGPEPQPLGHRGRRGQTRRTGRACGGTPRAGSAPPGHGVRRLTGMWVCSVTHSDSNPRSSSSMASRSGRIDRSVGKISAPMCIGRGLYVAGAARARTREHPVGAAVWRVDGMFCGTRVSRVTPARRMVDEPGGERKRRVALFCASVVRESKRVRWRSTDSGRSAVNAEVNAPCARQTPWFPYLLERSLLGPYGRPCGGLSPP